MAIFSSLKTQCDFCGKSLNKFEKRKLSEITGCNYGTTQDNIEICPHCFSVIQYVANIANLSDAPDQTRAAILMMNNYKSNFRKDFLIKNRISDVWLKNAMDELLQEADLVCKTYDSYPDLINTTFDKLEPIIDSLPKKRFDCGVSTIAGDDSMIYFMRYGNPIIKNKDLFNIKEIRHRKNIAEEFIENILNKDELIESIEINNIIYFQEKGELNYSTSVSGGGGGGVSLGKAVIGGVLFGTAGAVIGGLMGNKVDEVKSEAVKHDDRYTVIRYIDEFGDTVEKNASYEYFLALNELIPEKEFEFVKLNSTQKDVNLEVKSDSVVPVKELKALKELLDMEIITEVEFEIKKKQLLGI